jgi:hypothetical protein
LLDEFESVGIPRGGFRENMDFIDRLIESTRKKNTSEDKGVFTAAHFAESKLKQQSLLPTCLSNDNNNNNNSTTGGGGNKNKRFNFDGKDNNDDEEEEEETLDTLQIAKRAKVELEQREAALLQASEGSSLMFGRPMEAPQPSSSSSSSYMASGAADEDEDEDEFEDG